MTYPALGARLVPVLLALILAAAPATAQDRLAITPVIVVDMQDGTLRPDQTVLIVGDRIAALGPSTEIGVPEGAKVVDGSGQYLIPGLWDMHVHASREGRAARFWPTLVAHGVTGFRELGSHVDSLLYWRDQAAIPENRAPRIHWGVMVDGVPPVYDMSMAVADAKAAVAAVDSLADLGFDFVKVYQRIGREAYFALAERAQQRGIPFVGHVPTSVTVLEAVEAGQASFEHATDLLVACTLGTPVLPPSLVPADQPSSEEEGAAVQALSGQIISTAPTAAACADLLDRMRAEGTWLTPTMTIGQSIAGARTFSDDPRLARVPPGRLEVWEDSRFPAAVEAQIGATLLRRGAEAVRIAHEAGIPILAGTDASDMPRIFVGSGLHDELGHLVAAGLTPLESLQAATLNPAQFMDRTDEFGTVAVGKRADLVLLGANPLEDIANVRQVRAVVLRGEHLDRDALDAMAAMEWAGVD